MPFPFPPPPTRSLFLLNPPPPPPPPSSAQEALDLSPAEAPEKGKVRLTLRLQMARKPTMHPCVASSFTKGDGDDGEAEEGELVVDEEEEEGDDDGR